MLVEVACFNKEDAIKAYLCGANRIEFCSNYFVGGLSPTLEDIEYVVSKVSIPVTIMLRPHEGRFIYSLEDEEKMQVFLNEVKQLDVGGIVFGVEYSAEWTSVLKLWVERIDPLPITFHRAIENFPNQLEAIHQMHELGIQRILTGGSSKGVMNHLNELKILLENIPNDLEIILGGGIRSNNIETLKKMNKIKWIHTACFNQHTQSLDTEELTKLIHFSSAEVE